jgi:hypothetical protein
MELGLTHASQVKTLEAVMLVEIPSLLPLKLNPLSISPVVDLLLVFATDVPLLLLEVESATVVLAALSSRCHTPL